MKSHHIATASTQEGQSRFRSDPPRALIRGILTAATALALWVGAANPAQAAFTFTINASPTSDALGYVTTQTYNFVYTMNTAPDAGLGPFQPGSASAGANYTWLQEWNFDSEVWTKVAGDGLAGTWTEPSASAPDPFSQLIASTGNPSLKLYGGADVSNVGLTAAGLPVQWISFDAAYVGLSFSNITATLPDPNTYFGSYAGTYAESSTTTGWIHAVGGDAFFVVNNMTLAAAPAPEPSTVVMLAGGLGTLFSLRRRRRTAA